MSNGMMKKIFSPVKSMSDVLFIGIINKINKPKNKPENVKRKRIKRNSANYKDKEEYYSEADESSDNYDDSSDD